MEILTILNIVCAIGFLYSWANIFYQKGIKKGRDEYREFYYGHRSKLINEIKKTNSECFKDMKNCLGGGEK